MSASHDYQADIDAIARIRAVPTILDVVTLTTGMRFAAVARVTRDRWIACSVRDEVGLGLEPGGELKVETTICDAIRNSREPVAIDHVAEDPCYGKHPTPAMYGFQSYVSVPILMPDGSMFGTLCALDPLPTKVKTPKTIGMFEKFADLIAFSIDADQKLAASEDMVLSQQRTSELREQFIAVLGHDLRNPLFAIAGGVELIAKTPLDEKAERIVPRVTASVARMAALIDNILDFARGRLGDGLTLARELCDLAPVLTHVVGELRASHHGHAIDLDLALVGPVDCDPGRISQLVSNLVGNALTHGASEKPVRVRASNAGECFELSVSNSGEPIPPRAIEKLFEPFERGIVKPSLQGLGLGLYIASQIARAHDGSISVASDSTETRFTFVMPKRRIEG